MRLRWMVPAMFVLAAPAANAQQPGTTDEVALCGTRKPCRVVAVTPAGADAQGRAMRVIELDLGPKDPAAAPDDRMECRPYAREFWLATAGQGEPRRMLSLCNDGYGASGVGEDEIEIRANRLVHTQSGGSAWRWTTRRTVELSPLRVLDEESCSYHNINIGYSVTKWDWQRWSGVRHWFPQACKENDPREKDRPDWCDSDRATRRHAVIPRFDVALPAGPPPHLGSCAAAFDESGRAGYVVFGQPRANGTEFRVLMPTPRDLVVTVTDASFATGAASWLHDDHIELWLGQNHSGLSCSLDSKIRLSQWGVSLDGKIHHGTGDRASPPRLVARAARSVGRRQQVTLHLRLAEVEEHDRALTVVFSKSEGGKQVRLTATSPVRRGDSTSLSSLHRIEANAARCAVREGALELEGSGLPALLGE